jgi:hypothetical protein
MNKFCCGLVYSTFITLNSSFVGCVFPTGLPWSVRLLHALTGLGLLKFLNGLCRAQHSDRGTSGSRKVRPVASDKEVVSGS